LTFKDLFGFPLPKNDCQHTGNLYAARNSLTRSPLVAVKEVFRGSGSSGRTENDTYRDTLLTPTTTERSRMQNKDPQEIYQKSFGTRQTVKVTH